MIIKKAWKNRPIIADLTLTPVEVHCFNRKTLPPDGVTIADELDIEKLIKTMVYLEYYFRSPEQCPFNRGNWIVDIKLKNGETICYKYPKEMTQEKFEEFLSPLLSKLYGAKITSCEYEKTKAKK